MYNLYLHGAFNQVIIEYRVMLYLGKYYEHVSTKKKYSSVCNRVSNETKLEEAHRYLLCQNNKTKQDGHKIVIVKQYKKTSPYCNEAPHEKAIRNSEHIQ
jgi:hypothetical protein